MLACGGGGDSGGGGGDDGADKGDDKANKDAQKEIENQQKAEGKVIKLLLLGAGESGKSTIFKQMKVINQNGYSDAERATFKSIVHSNVVVSIKNMMGAAAEKLSMTLDADLQAMVDEFEGKTADDNNDISKDGIGALVKSIWCHSQSKEIFSKRSEFQLNDSAEYYFDAVDRLSEPGYCPTLDDVLRSRVRTTGIVQSDFKIKATSFSMFDVGGQRNERRKWIHCFDHVTAVCFVAALSEFDQTLYEDDSQNRFDEAVDLFKQISNSKWFRDTDIILFLNKKDLFQAKLEKKNFYDHVKLYKDEVGEDNDFARVRDWCKDHFIKQRTTTKESKPVYSHVTTATDTKNVAFVFNAVVSILLEKNLKESGIM